MAVLYFETGNFDKAIKYFNILIKLEPNKASNNFDLAQSYVARFRKNGEKKADLDDLKQALFYLKKTEELEPNFPHALNNIKVIEKIIQTYTTT